MNSGDFNFQRIAEGYGKRPFLHKQVIERFQKDINFRTFSNGLDIGCGAGLSAKALKMICRHVTGTDISSEMIAVAKEVCGTEEYEFDQDAFIEFMMIQSNVNVKIEGEGKNILDVREWFEQSLEPVFRGEKRTVIFTGYSWYMEKL